jgi:hypothetical protein
MNYPAASERGIKNRKPKKLSPQSSGGLDPLGINFQGIAMSSLLQKLILAAIFFIFLFVTGFWVSKSGKPVNLIKMNIHKFIALGAVVFVGITFFRILPRSNWGTLEVVAVAASGIFAVAAIVTGGLSSLARPLPAATAIHKVTPYLALLSTAATLYLLVG